MKLRDWIWLLSLSMSAAACGLYAQLTTSFDAPSVWRVILFAVIGVTGIGMVFLTRRVNSRWQLLSRIWIPAILLRLLLLPTAPSDDLNRYLWEGRLVAEGESPYEFVADAPERVEWRDLYWEGMNHKDKQTAYPPLSQIVFGAVSGAVYHPMAFKVVFVLADLLTLAGALALLRLRGLSLAYSGFYAFNPLVLLSFAAEGHFDSLMLAPLVWSVYALLIGRPHLAVLLGCMATGIKWVTLPLIPFLAGRKLVSGALLAVLSLLLPALFFWETLPELCLGLFVFGTAGSFNAPVFEALLFLGLQRSLVSAITLGLFALIILWRWIQRDHFAVDAHLRWILASLILLSPIVHFWYLVWIIPFVCLRPSLPWLMFSLSGGVYFFVWINAASNGWGLTLPQVYLFWTPFALACLYEVWSTRGRVLFPLKIEAQKCETVAVVIPTLNAAESLGKALASVSKQNVSAAEVVVVDAGSEDATLAIVEKCELPIRLIISERGRGQQIAAGIEAATADWVIVLHADAELEADSIAQLQAAVRGQSDVVGGAFGQSFEDEKAMLLPIELLNDLRGLFTRTAFGDQLQFFHRETALRYEFMPKQPLMEDVESSWRAREAGGFIYLSQPIRVSYRSWQASDWFRRFGLVLRLVSRYRAARLKSRAAASALSEEMYAEYYKIRK